MPAAKLGSRLAGPLILVGLLLGSGGSCLAFAGIVLFSLAVLFQLVTPVSYTHLKSNFLARMSHDIRTPMNAIIGMTAIAMSHSHEPERVEDCLKKINMSSSHLHVSYTHLDVYKRQIIWVTSL